MLIPKFIFSQRASLPNHLRANLRGQWSTGTSYQKNDVVYYPGPGGDYFQAKTDTTMEPDFNNFIARLHWEQVNVEYLPIGYARDYHPTDYAYTGTLKSEIAGHGAFPFIYKGYTQSTEVGGPDAFHLYNKDKARLQDYYDGPHMAIAQSASDGGGGKAMNLEYTYRFGVFEVCHGTKPLNTQGTQGSYNFYNAFYAPGYYQPPYGENPTFSIIGGDEGIEGQMAELNMLAGETVAAGGCCKKLKTEEKRQIWGIRTVFPTAQIPMSTDVARGQEHAIHAPSEECPPEFPPAYYFSETSYAWHPGSIMARLAGNFYNDNPFPTPLDTDGHAQLHVYQTQKCYSAPLYQGWKLKNGYPELSYPIAGTTEYKLRGNICNARRLETNTAVGECSSCINIQLGSATGPGAATNDQANFFGYSDAVYWHWTFRYNAEEFFNDTHNTTSNLVTSFLGDEARGPSMATEDHYWTYRQCPNTIDYLPWTVGGNIHACPNEYFDVPYYAAIGKFGFYGARFLNKCGRPSSNISNVVIDEDGVADDEYNFYKIRSLSSALDFPPEGDQLWGFMDGAHILRVKKQFDTGKTYSIENSIAQFHYKTLKINEECYILQYSHTSNRAGESYELEISNTAYSTSADSYCEGDSSLSQENCKSFCIPSHDRAGNKITARWHCEQQGSWLNMFLEPGTWYERRWVVDCGQMPNIIAKSNNPIYSLAASVAGSESSTSYVMKDVSTASATFPKDWDVVQDCEECNCHNSNTQYVEPPVLPSTCSEDDYRTLLKVAKNEQRMGDFYAGNIGFFFWANWNQITASNEWNNLLTGIGEEGFKRALWRLKNDFDKTLGSKSNFLTGMADSIILYEGGSGPEALYQTGPLSYASDSEITEDILFTNNRYERFLREIEEDKRNNIFCMGEKAELGWKSIIKKWGNYVSLPGGAVDEDFYKTLITGREKRLLTRHVEAHNRGTPTDLFPLNHITFAVDQASGYVGSLNWGKARYGNTIDSAAAIKPLPAVERRYFEGVYASKSLVTGIQDLVQLSHARVNYFYGGLYRNPNCGGDLPRKLHNIVGTVQGSTYGGEIPRTPWKLEGLNGIGKLDPNFSCFTPIFVQQPLDTTCKLGQSPTFRCLAVDYHTLPEDKVGKGYPEIDFWVNNLKIASSDGTNLYPIEYQWYRIPIDEVSVQDPAVSVVPIDSAGNAGVRHGKLGNEYRYLSVLDRAEPASLDGNWACIEGKNGKGNTECTMFHPWESVSESMVDAGMTEDEFYEAAGGEGWNGNNSEWPDTPPQRQTDNPPSSISKIRPPTGYCNFNPIDMGLAGTFIHCANAGGICTSSSTSATLYASGSTTMKEMYGPNAGDSAPYSLIRSGVQDGNTQYTVTHGEWNTLMTCEGVLRPTGAGGWVEDITCNGIVPGSDAGEPNPDKIVFRKGAKKQDEDFYYFAVASGRFGINRSEYINLEAESFLRLDVSVRNGSPVNGSLDAGLLVNPWFLEGKTVAGWERISLTPGLFGVDENTSPGLADWNGSKHGTNKVMPFAGCVRDPNVAWENTWRAFIRMSNNCKSYAPVGMENYRGITRSYQPPVQVGIRGTRADNASYFEYGLLYPFGTYLNYNLTNKTSFGDAIYGYQHLPKCQDYKMQNGRRGPRLNLLFDGHLIRNYSINDPAVIAEHNPPGLRPRQLYHHGELYPKPEGDEYRDYGENGIGFYAMGSLWQGSNLFGKIPRFGHDVKFPDARVGAHEDQSFANDTDDMYFWGGGISIQRRNFKDAQRLIGPQTLAGKNCGWCGSGRGEGTESAENSDEYSDCSASRFVLHFWENYQRFYLSCDSSGKKRKLNYSYIAPGLRRGSSAIQFFWGGTPHNTYLKREPMYGPYAFEWKTINHNRDRNGNGLSEAFYSTRYNRKQYLYDPPAVYGLYMRQHQRIDNRVQWVKKWRKAAFGPGYHIKGTRFGRPGIKSGCGEIRLHCVEEDRDGESIPYIHALQYGSPLPVWTTPHNSNKQCHYYHYGKNLGIDPGKNYGCDNKQLAGGLCFDPCLSMKYNYGFFPGGKLLALNSYTKYKRSLNVFQDRTAGVDKYITQISHNDDDTDINLSYTRYNPPTLSGLASIFSSLALLLAGTSYITSGSRPGGYRRIIRGPWLTPYKLIRESLVAEHIGAGTLAAVKQAYPSELWEDGDQETWTDHKQRVNVQNSATTDIPRWVRIPKDDPPDLPSVPNSHGSIGYYKKHNLRKYVKTEVSPCESRGADHCNYVTATCHLGMDSIVAGMQDTFSKWSGIIGGQFTSEEPSLIERLWGDTGRWLMTGESGNGVQASSGKCSKSQYHNQTDCEENGGDWTAGKTVKLGPSPSGNGLAIFVIDSDGNESIIPTDNMVEFVNALRAGSPQGVSDCEKDCLSRAGSPLDIPAGSNLSSAECRKRANDAVKIATDCTLSCDLEDAMNSNGSCSDPAGTLANNASGYCRGSNGSNNRTACSSAGGTWVTAMDYCRQQGYTWTLLGEYF